LPQAIRLVQASIQSARGGGKLVVQPFVRLADPFL
jgi:hypothetical protein